MSSDAYRPTDDELDWVKAEARRLSDEDGHDWDALSSPEFGRYIDQAYKNLMERKKATAFPVRPNGARHPEVEHLLSLFAWKHLPLHLQPVSKHCSELANDMANRLEDGYELIVGLRHLLYAKDAFVRQAVVDHREES